MTAPTRFEDRLQRQLHHVVAENPAPARPAPRHRRPGRIVLAGAGCAAALAAVAVVAGSGGTTTKAYAVESRPGGDVAVSINETSDAAGLQRSLEDEGIPAVVDYDPADQAACVETPAATQNSAGADDVDSVKAYETAGGAVWSELPRGKPFSDPSAHSKKENAFGDLSDTVKAEAGGNEFLVDPSRIQTGDKLVITSSDGTVETVAIAVSSDAAAGCAPDAP
jgi:hypothetical protein